MPEIKIKPKTTIKTVKKLFRKRSISENLCGRI